ncbi:hypothetical protein HYFRA_00000023 [Hymenoscyphus fraxineus]|uniref:Uncharacterized protein n=1 Tax=Hymenoscyphus fraxineus TaxID=746836 RepID=A0A9N9L3X4_9HELO|nr:hypothetical protein HYFRA_00000023 [Hymenoscyphus fraxineus]
MGQVSVPDYISTKEGCTVPILYHSEPASIPDRWTHLSRDCKSLRDSEWVIPGLAIGDMAASNWCLDPRKEIREDVSMLSVQQLHRFISSISASAPVFPLTDRPRGWKSSGFRSILVARGLIFTRLTWSQEAQHIKPRWSVIGPNTLIVPFPSRQASEMAHRQSGGYKEEPGVAVAGDHAEERSSTRFTLDQGRGGCASVLQCLAVVCTDSTQRRQHDSFPSNTPFARRSPRYGFGLELLITLVDITTCPTPPIPRTVVYGANGGGKGSEPGVRDLSTEYNVPIESLLVVVACQGGNGAASTPSGWPLGHGASMAAFVHLPPIVTASSCY